MANVTLDPQVKPGVLDPYTAWTKTLEDNIDKANANDQALRAEIESAAGADDQRLDALEAFDDTVVTSIKFGPTTYSPDNGLATIPLPKTDPPALTEAQRDALQGADLYVPRFIFNTTRQRLEVYTSTGWQPVGGGTSSSAASNPFLLIGV